ncbi:BET1-like protein [Dinothrombium tinctorium]|uniref:BET1-like protein n=1 Tax=Dinothrombium tinctorium TaxID=1965070 RepID=A0A443RLV8_9ACAR|nr:BET1-like protein [Dinothrombium tinctorium]
MAKRSNAYQYNGYTGYGSHDSLEMENNAFVDGLRTKVGALKNLTIDMGEEIREQNKYLKEMDNDFDSTQGLLSSSFNRVKRLAMAGHNKYILYLILFSLFVFFVIYVLIRFR